MNLKDKHFSIGIWSENHEALAKWYEDVLGFVSKEKMTLSNDTYIAFDFGPENDHFFIGKHDKVHAENKDPYRIMIGFHVHSIDEAFNSLQDKNVTFIAKPFEAPTKKFWCMTIQDPEGNILQFMGQK